jgi:hypothetical protein
LGFVDRQDATALRTTTLSSADDFASISEQVSEFRRSIGACDDLHTDPAYFLACTDSVRRSCSVACWRGSELAGVLYAFEHYVGGIGTGYALAGDYSGRGGLVACPAARRAVASAAVDHLMRHGIHCLHLRFSPAPGSAPDLGNRRSVHFHETIPGDRLPLAPTYEQFLATIGKHTRRNIRHYTRRAAAHGIAFDPAVPEPEYTAAVRRLSQAAEFPIVGRRLARDLRLIEQYRGDRFALRDGCGQIVAVLCGFSVNHRFYLLSQVNDARLSPYSLSLVLRGLTIEHLIERGHRELQFMGGTSLALGRFCERLDYSGYFIDRPHWLLSPLKRMAAGLVKLLGGLRLRVPVQLEMVSGSYLDPSRLAAHTPLMPAAVVQQEENIRQRKPSTAPVHAAVAPVGERRSA